MWSLAASGRTSGPGLLLLSNGRQSLGRVLYLPSTDELSQWLICRDNSTVNIVLIVILKCINIIITIAVSTRPPAGVVSALRASVSRIYRASRSNSFGPCGPLSGVLLAFTRWHLLLHC